MKKKIFICIMAIGIVMSVNSLWAATYSLSKSSITLNVGAKSTVTLNGSGVAGGPFSVTSSNSSIASATALSTNWVENSSGTFTISAKSAGTATITVSGTVANLNDSADESTVTKKIVVTVKEKTATVTPQTKTSTQTTKTTSTTVKKSSDAKIIGLSLDVEGLSPKFTKNITSYKINVDHTVNKLNIKLSLSDRKATYKITGNKDFKVGENIVKIKVTAENRTTTKTYTIKVNKAPDLTLSSLTVSNAELTKEFDPSVLEYKLKDISDDVKKLDINAATNSDAATVKIAGNDILVTGENIIKIVVSDESGKNSRVYTLTVNKVGALPAISENVEDEEVVEQNSLIEKINHLLNIGDGRVKQNITIVALYILSVVEFILLLYMYKKLKEKNSDCGKITMEDGNAEKNMQPRRRMVDIEIDTAKNEETRIEENSEE